MKKVLIFCLILLCTLSVFAADVSAKAKVYLSYGDGGFSSTNYKGTWEPVISLSFTNDFIEEASFKWCPISFNSSDYDICFKFKPFCSITQFYNEKLQDTTLTVGTYCRANSSFMAYGAVDFVSDEFVDPKATSKIRKDNRIFAGLGFGFKPNSINDFSNVDLFIAGYFNNVNKNFGNIHFDGVLKLNIEGNKPSLNYSLTELTFNRFKFEDKETSDDYYYGLNGTTDKIVAVEGKFGFDEDYFFDHETRYNEHEGTFATFNPGFVAGLRYKYFTEAEKTVYTGLYAYGLGSYHLKETENKSNVSFEAEAEIGYNNAELEIESRGIVYENTPEKFYSQYKFDWADGKLDASITDVSLYLIHPVEKGEIHLQFNYKNLSTNSAKDNGFFFNPEFKTSIGSVIAFDVVTTIGFDSLKNFRWNVQSSFETSF